MLIEKDKHWFVDCDGAGCKADLHFAYTDRASAIGEMVEEKWELRNVNQCYCPKCVKKGV